MECSKHATLQVKLMATQIDVHDVMLCARAEISCARTYLHLCRNY